MKPLCLNEKNEDDMIKNHLRFKSSPGNVLLSHGETP